MAHPWPMLARQALGPYRSLVIFSNRGNQEIYVAPKPEGGARTGAASTAARATCPRRISRNHDRIRRRVDTCDPLTSGQREHVWPNFPETPNFPRNDEMVFWDAPPSGGASGTSSCQSTPTALEALRSSDGDYTVRNALEVLHDACEKLGDDVSKYLDRAIDALDPDGAEARFKERQRPA